MTASTKPPATEKPALLYESSAKIQSRRAQGRYARLRVLAMLLLLGFYYIAPWIQIGDTPLVWLDLPHRRFHVFTLTLAPQDLIFLTWLLLIAALTLFFFTTLGGRLWCGYACPQTVWTEAFIWMEHLAEGDRYARIKLDRAPWGPEKILRRGAKHLLWAGFALFTGLSFVAYFVPARELFPEFFALQLAGWPLFWTLFYGFATWGNAGVMREQVCKYMCPYARFQSAMFDKDTLIISYDQKRGEPRKSVAKLSGVPAGDCIDCSLCVQVCPTGIDIRKGLQYECIACAACVDACNSVMDSVHKPRGLIRYTSAHEEKGQKFRLLRPRVIGYGLIWVALCVGFVVAILLRTPVQFDVIRDRHSLYRELDDGAIENLYTLKVSNETSAAHRFKLSVSAEDGRRFLAVPDSLLVGRGEAQALTVSVRSQVSSDENDDEDENRLHGIHSLKFSLVAEDDPKLQRERTASFIAGEGHD